MQLHVFETTGDTIRAGYECPCGCRPSVTYQRTSETVHDGCCCGNEFALGPRADAALGSKPGYHAEATSLDPPWGEPLKAAWLIGPSVHSDELHDHSHDRSDNGSHGHEQDPHEAGSSAVFELDPVCGMRVDVENRGRQGAARHLRGSRLLFLWPRLQARLRGGSRAVSRPVLRAINVTPCDSY